MTRPLLAYPLEQPIGPAGNFVEKRIDMSGNMEFWTERLRGILVKDVMTWLPSLGVAFLLLLGLMGISAFFSMWVGNTATAAMLIPVAVTRLDVEPARRPVQELGRMSATEREILFACRGRKPPPERIAPTICRPPGGEGPARIR
jgi:hypothetical protein